MLMASWLMLCFPDGQVIEISFQLSPKKKGGILIYVLPSWYFSDFFSHLLCLLTQFMNQLKIPVQLSDTQKSYFKKFFIF